MEASEFGKVNFWVGRWVGDGGLDKRLSCICIFMHFAFCNCVTICTKSNKSTFGLWRPGESGLGTSCLGTALVPHWRPSWLRPTTNLVFSYLRVFVFFASLYLCIFVLYLEHTEVPQSRPSKFLLQPISPLKTLLVLSLKELKTEIRDWTFLLSFFLLGFEINPGFTGPVG